MSLNQNIKNCKGSGILSSLLISHDVRLLLFHRHKQKICDIKTSLSTMLLTIHPGLHGPLPQALEWCGILSQLKKTKVGNGSFSEQAEQIYPSVLCLGSHYFIPQGRTSPGKRPDKEQSELAFLSNSARRFSKKTHDRRLPNILLSNLKSEKLRK